MNYIAHTNRPDISYAVGLLSSFIQKSIDDLNNKQRRSPDFPEILECSKEWLM